MASPVATSTKNAKTKDDERRTVLNAVAKHNAWEKKQKLVSVTSADGKTSFIVSDKAKGEKRLAEYEKQQKIYLGS